MKNVIKFAMITSVSAQAATVWKPAPNALASVSWDSWSYSTASGETGNGTQGSAQTSSGSLVTSSELTTNVTDAYEFPGGLGSNPDTYYFHTGGATWGGSLQLSGAVSYVRVSYSLLGFGGAPPDAYAAGPSIAGATVINTAFYGTSSDGIEGTVFVTDLELDSAVTEIEMSFGDVIFQGFPGSFRSVDGVRIEVLNAVPIPEPSSVALAFFGGLLTFRRRR